MLGEVFQQIKYFPIGQIARLAPEIYKYQYYFFWAFSKTFPSSSKIMIRPDFFLDACLATSSN